MEQDELTLKSGKLSDNRRNCLVFQIGEKRIYHWLIELCGSACEVLESDSYEIASMQLCKLLAWSSSQKFTDDESARIYFEQFLSVLIDNYYLSLERLDSPSDSFDSLSYASSKSDRSSSPIALPRIVNSPPSTNLSKPSTLAQALSQHIAIHHQKSIEDRLKAKHSNSHPSHQKAAQFNFHPQAFRQLSKSDSPPFNQQHLPKSKVANKTIHVPTLTNRIH